MSNPARQVNSRRLPPLPGMNKSNPNTSPRSARSPRGTHSPRSPHYRGGANSPGLLEMVVKGHNSNHHDSHHHHHGRSPDPREYYQQTALQLEQNPEIMTTFLNENPDFLESYVQTHIRTDTLERWLIRRTHHKSKHRNTEKPLVNGDATAEERRESLSRWRFCVHADKRKMLSDLTRDIHHQPNKAQVLSELTECVAAAVGADGCNLYLVDESGKELYYYKPNTSSTKAMSPCIRKIGKGSTIAAYVAHTKEPIRLSEILGDDRFPEGIEVGGQIAQSVLAQPIVQASGDVVGVMEIYRTVGNPAFGEEDDEVFASYTMCSSMMCTIYEMYHTMTKQRKLNEFLLAVTKSIFQDIVSMDTVIMKIMNFAKKLVLADRASLFLMDTKTSELYARIFDTGEYDENNPRPVRSQKEIRFPMDKGVAGHVATTGEILNIPDAYSDVRFNRDVDLQTGYTTRTILCMPIKIRGNIIGVVQMVNKLNGTFTKADEESFETFAVYCGLALHHAKLYDKIRRSQQKYKVALEVLSYHGQCSEDEYSRMRAIDVPEHIDALTRYDFSPWDVDNDKKPIFVIYMFKDLFNMFNLNRPGCRPEERFDLETLYRFTLTVRKNYRTVPYHNWAHAFSVAHAMYTVIKTTKQNFEPLEALGLFVACLCHDLDHRGKTNSFMVKSASPLAAIYSTSTMEHHHFNQTVSILQNEGHNIFKNFTSEEYKKVLGDIRHCILATDLQLFFSNRAKLQELSEKKAFDWDNMDHKNSIMAHCMTAADLCGMYKPWNSTYQLVNIIMEEFWQQVGFLVGICLPCYELLAQLLPETSPMVEGAKANLKKWKELADKQKAEQNETAQSEEENAKKAED